MILGFLIFLSLICSGAAVAQTLQVRSGEHDGFTRLVIDIARGTRWAMAAGPDPYDHEIQFPGSRFSFDTSDVFDRLNAGRLSAIGIAGETGNLGLDLSCDCAVDAFVMDGNMLVVDISDVRADAPAKDSTRPRSGPDLTPQGRLLLPDTFVPTPQTYGALPLDKLNTWSGKGPNHISDVVGAESRDAALAQIERNVTQQLASAVTRGLLDVSADPAGPGADLQDGPTEANNLRPANAKDRQVNSAGPPKDRLHAMLEDGRILLSGDRCTDDQDLALADWASGAPFDTQLRELRQNLIGEFDRVNGKDAERLARFYLHYGFGPEAAAILDMTDFSTQKSLRALALLLDGKPDPEGTFVGQTHCEGSAALWSMLDLRAADSRGSVNTKAILRGFDALPDPLKAYLANNLVDELLALGEKAAAQSLMKRVTRSQDQPNAEIELAKAKLDIDDGLVKQASTRLTDVARNASVAESAYAVESLMEINAEHGEPVAADISELASAYSVEFRGTEAGPGLWRAHVRALVGNGDFEAVFQELNTQSSGDDALDKDVRAEVAKALITNADDLTFMRLALATSPEKPLGGDREILLSAAERMLTVGLPDAAAALLDQAGADRDDREARLLHARILLAQDRPEDAEIAMIGLQGSGVQKLRTDARVMMGDYDYAQTAFAEAGSTEKVAESAWISGNWSTVAETTDGPLSEAARLVQAEATPPDAVGNPSLGASQTLVGDSEAARETLRALLEATRIAPDS